MKWFENKKSIGMISLFVLLFVFPTFIFAGSSLADTALSHLSKVCDKSNISGLNAVLCYHEDRLDDLQAQIDEINSSPSPDPSPSLPPGPEALPPIELVLADSKQASFEVPFEVPGGYDLVTFNVSSTESIINWAVRVKITPETTMQEQHRFDCNGSSICPEESVPVLGTDYVFSLGTSSGLVTATATLEDIPGAQTMVLGSHVNLNFYSNPFDTTGFNGILITAGQQNPQNLHLISLQRFNGSTYDRVGDLVCDGGAECPATIQPVLGGDYRVLVEGVGGFGLDALVGAILLP